MSLDFEIEGVIVTCRSCSMQFREAYAISLAAGKDALGFYACPCGVISAFPIEIYRLEETQRPQPTGVTYETHT